ncbi:MAG TPA: GNAT family N-acetyltransferase, partial [Trebonia sp.]
AMLDVERAAFAADDPLCPLSSPRVFQARLALGPPHRHPGEAWCLPNDASGGLAGWYYLKLPDIENQDWGGLELMVDPATRRRGLGTALLRHAAGRARAQGRAELYGDIAQGSAGEEFGRRAGARYGLADIRRVLDLDMVPAERVAACRERAAKAAAGYSLVSWQGRTPDELIAGVARMYTTMNDAPNGPELEPDLWDEQRIRDRADGWIAAIGSRSYQVAAICDATGEMAALTESRVDPEIPDWGHQGNTAVARPHRGHRLGLLVKATLTQWLRDAEPGVRKVVTYNSAANPHMIAINEELGYEVSGATYLETQISVSHVLGG